MCEVFGNDCPALEELNAFIAILYARGAFGANTLAAKDLWDKTWDHLFLLQSWVATGFLISCVFYVLTSELRDVCACKRISIASDPKKIPETVAFYNSTNYGVDVVDQMARKYSVKASWRRWPVQVFYNILDLAAINAWILYKETTRISITRRQFILKLANELNKPYAQERAASMRSAARRVLQEADMQVRGTKRRKCQVARCKGNKTCDTCSVCKKVVCGVCTAQALTRYICAECGCVTITTPTTTMSRTRCSRICNRRMTLQCNTASIVWHILHCW